MVVLHFASIRNNPFSGVCVAVTQHVSSQAELAEVGFVNVNPVKIDGLENQLDCTEDFDVASLPAPFDRPDIVVFHEAYQPAFLRVAKQLRRRHIPYVIIPHGELTQEAQKKKRLKKWAANLLLFNRFINGAAAVQCLSKRELAATHFGRQKFVGTNGVYMPDIIKRDFHQDETVFVYIGRLEVYYKGLDLLTEAIALEKDFLLRNKCKFCIFGPEFRDWFTNVQGLIEKFDVGELVFLNHAITGKEKEELLLNSDVFIQTSRSEGMPMGILEAMSYGLPCLVTTGTSLGEFVKENDAGWVCEIDARAIGRTIVEAVKEKQLFAAKAARAKAAVEAHFSWPNVSKAALERYREIVEK